METYVTSDVVTNLLFSGARISCFQRKNCLVAALLAHAAVRNHAATTCSEPRSPKATPSKTVLWPSSCHAAAPPAPSGKSSSKHKSKCCAFQSFFGYVVPSSFILFLFFLDHLSFIRRDQNKEERKREKKRMNE